MAEVDDISKAKTAGPDLLKKFYADMLLIG